MVDPHGVAGLRVAGSVSDRIRLSVEGELGWLDLEDASAPEDLAELGLHFALLELGPGTPAGPEQLGRYVDVAHTAGVPVALWLTSPELPAGPDLDLVRRADVVLCADPGHARRLENGARAVGLPAAASRLSLSLEHMPQRRVGLVIEPGLRWPRKRSARVDEILAAIPDDELRVFAIEPVAADVPDHLLEGAERGDSYAALAAFLRRCAAVVTPLPDAASVLYVPPLVFDAAAIGVPVVVPRAMGRGYLLPRVCAVAAGTPEAGALLSRALDKGEVSGGRREAGQVSARHEHTYAHRLATVASCFSHSVMPVAPPLPG